MKRIISLVFCLFMATIGISYANEIDYSSCKSVHEVIIRETQEIASTHPGNHDELAQLYASRGESYLLDAQYEKAVENFQKATSHIGYCSDGEAAMIVAFRAAFGEAVSYDNLGMTQQTEQALDQLKTIADYIVCNDCIEHRPCQEMLITSATSFHFRDFVKPAINKVYFKDRIVNCKHKKDNQGANEQQQSSQDNYEDIRGPNQPPDSNWCEEVVTGVGRAMDAIACLAPNYAVKVTLIGVIEALITRGVKCCQAGGFWKACVAPITRKWREWKNNKEKNVVPNTQNLPLYTN